MSRIEHIINGLLEREGGYVDHPSDRGGPTCWGITEKTARQEGYVGDMHSMPRPTAYAIYLRKYWSEPGFEDVYNAVPGLTEPIGEELLDTGTNMGQATAGKFLQRCLNVLNGRGKYWPDLEVDGDVGPNTVGAVRSLMKQRGTPGAVVLLRMLNALQGARYIELAEQDPSQEDFEFGWQLNRVGGV